MTAPGLSFTLTDLLSSAMRLCRVLTPEEVPTAEELATGILVANQMLDAWNADRLTVFTINISDFQLVAGKQTYALGAGGDFNMARPAQIERMSVMVMSNPVVPMELSLHYTESEAEWQSVVLKGISTTFPQFCYDDGSFPNRNLNLYPVPLDSVNKLRIYSWQPLSVFSDATTQLSFPPGYAEAIRYNLALRINGEFDGAMSQTDQLLAVSMLARIKTINRPLDKLKCDEAVVGTAAISPNYRQELFNIP